jgi:PAS domain S-box-containing protein
VSKSLWELLWEYDPNGLIVVDPEMRITLVNSSFCRMLKMEAEDLIGRPAYEVLGDVEDFEEVRDNQTVIPAKEKEYLQYGLYVREVIFPIQDEGIIACIIVDLTHEWQQKQDLLKLKHQTLEQVNRVVDNQMKVAQEIAGLLGETTAATKVSLLSLMSMLQQEAG